MFTPATNNATCYSMDNVHTSTVTSKTILNAGLQMQGKDQLNKQMQDWQKHMDEHKQVERSAIAYKLIYERYLRMMEMSAKQLAVHEQPQYNILSNNNVIMDSSKQIMVPILVPLNMAFQSHLHAMTNFTSPSEDQHYNQSADIENAPLDADAIPHIPLPQEYVSNEDYQSSCSEWLLWHRTMPPTPYMGSDPVSEQEATTSYDPSLMLLDYLPFTSEDEISNFTTDSARNDIIQTEFDNDEEDDFNIIL